MKKKIKKKLELSKETLSLISLSVAGGATALCGTIQCPTSPNLCPQSGKYPC